MQHSDIRYLERCIVLAEEALHAGDEPFGSVLVGANGEVLREARNRAVTVDPTQHPEFELARWAGQSMSCEDRRAATVYTSGEHCPMCAAAHAWVGLGRIVFATSAAQLAGWMAAWGVGPPPINTLRIDQVAPSVPRSGPVPGMEGRVRELHRRRLEK